MIKVGMEYICKSNGLHYQVIEIIPYKSYYTKENMKTNRGWIDIVIYKPLYICEIKKFSREKKMFENDFFLLKS